MGDTGVAAHKNETHVQVRIADRYYNTPPSNSLALRASDALQCGCGFYTKKMLVRQFRSYFAFARETNVADASNQTYHGCIVNQKQTLERLVNTGYGEHETVIFKNCPSYFLFLNVKDMIS